MDPIILCGGLAEIDRNRVTVLVNDVEELNVELSRSYKELEKATLAVEKKEKAARLDASELKKSNSSFRSY
jgi:F0F1-type ATP synthase epsilon subunit